MRGFSIAGLFFGVLTVVMAGCESPKNQIKPPMPPETLAVPPADEARYSSPPAYPRDSLNQPHWKKSEPDPMRRPSLRGAGL
jgi:hypothetical protein